MRLVACLLAGLVLATVLPHVTNAADECASARISTAPGCVDSNTITMGQVSARVYVYLTPLLCPQNAACTGSPPAHVIGLVWEESNTLTGLQRTPVLGNPADTPLLV